jgi:hypothetical protein
VRGTAKLGTSEWRQGFAPNIDFYDCAKVLKTGETICVPAKCYENVLVVKEWSPLDTHGGHQLTYYAPGWAIFKLAPWRIPKQKPWY